MKIIIDLPEEKYEWIKTHNPNIEADSIVGAVANGIPVSTDGDLISRSDLKYAINKIVDEEIEIDEKWAKGLKYSLKIIDNASAVPVAACINYKVCTSRKQEELISAIEDCED